MNVAVDSIKHEGYSFEPVEMSDEKIENRNRVARDISPIAIALLLLAVKLDNIEDSSIARKEKRELQNLVKECNADVVENLRGESNLNTWGPGVIFVLGLVLTGMGQNNFVFSEQAAASLNTMLSQLSGSTIQGLDQLWFMADKEEKDRTKQMTEQDLQTTHAQAQSARESFNQDLKRAMEAIINS